MKARWESSLPAFPWSLLSAAKSLPGLIVVVRPSLSSAASRTAPAKSLSPRSPTQMRKTCELDQ